MQSVTNPPSLDRSEYLVGVLQPALPASLFQSPLLDHSFDKDATEIVDEIDNPSTERIIEKLHSLETEGLDESGGGEVAQ